MILRLQKNADKEKGRIMLPKSFIEQWGRAYYMEIYTDHIKLIPIKKNSDK